jgi:polysaccharide deacetylase family protein (PEP-CTERM system associated)
MLGSSGSAEFSPENYPFPPATILSFDVEEHHRIEAASHLSISADSRRMYANRMESSTRLLLDLLARTNVKATFFVVGEIAESHPQLVRDIADAGHEVGSHSWVHRRVHHFGPESFRDDLLKSKDALEQATGTPVVGFRAPTFSVVRQTGWVIDVLADCGFEYDSSIFPVRHDRYGIPTAPRSPFIAEGNERSILELPLATLRMAGQNFPVAGGGYFRLFPLAVMKAGMRQLARTTTPPVSMLYFHPWEFDPEQPRLALGRLSRFRTYVGMTKSLTRLKRLLARGAFRRAIDVVHDIRENNLNLSRFQIPETLTPISVAA